MPRSQGDFFLALADAPLPQASFHKQHLLLYTHR